MPTEIKLTQGKVAIVDDEMFAELNKRKWFAKKDGTAFYAACNVGIFPFRRVLLMHRAIVDVDDRDEIDHRNGNTLDNRVSNLRVCSRTENSRNRRKPSNNASGYKGVSRYKPSQCWLAHIKVSGKIKHLGYFATAEDAARAYDAAAIKYHGEFARLNFPKEQKQ